MFICLLENSILLHIYVLSRKFVNHYRYSVRISGMKNVSHHEVKEERNKAEELVFKVCRFVV